MSQVDELLNTMSADETAAYTANAKTEEHIVIGEDRIVRVPDDLKRIAVQYDHNIETVTFDCPRYWDDHDMSTMAVYINYMRPDGYKDSYRADNVVGDGDIMQFTWTVSRNVTEVKGNVSFLVCVKNVDEDGNECNHWHSELNRELYISEGLEVGTTEFIDMAPDFVSELLIRMGDVESRMTVVEGAAVTKKETDFVTFPAVHIDFNDKLALIMDHDEIVSSEYGKEIAKIEYGSEGNWKDFDCFIGDNAQCPVIRTNKTIFFDSESKAYVLGVLYALRTVPTFFNLPENLGQLKITYYIE